MQSTMKVNGLTCAFHMPEALKTWRLEDGTEVALGLPPGNCQPVYPVDEYPACPPHWMNGSDKASSYFVGVEAGKGMWLDFNGCRTHNHDVAIIVSVQGVNSISGEPTIGGRFFLEQYREKCPKHGTAFQQDRFCPDCKFKWPAQNYLSSTGTPWGQLWLDGFRAADKAVRQYIFSEDEARGVAAKKIGEDRVFAIGIAYFLSKEAKPIQPTYQTTRRMLSFGGGPSYSKGIGGQSVGGWSNYAGGGLESLTSSKGLESFGLADEADYESCVMPCSASASSTPSAPSEPTASVNYSADNIKMASGPRRSMSKMLLADRPGVFRSMRVAETVKPVKNYEVAAGARINQEVHADPKELTYWSEEPAGMIYVNYCDRETLAKILAAGKRAEEADGMLAGLPVGNE